MLLIAVRAAEVEITYSAQQRLEYEGITYLQGPLDELIGKVPKSFELTIIPVLIQIVSEAWSMTVEQLRAQRWDLDLKENILWSQLLRRPK